MNIKDKLQAIVAECRANIVLSDEHPGKYCLWAIAGWRSTIAAIDAIEQMESVMDAWCDNDGRTCPRDGKIEALKLAILSAWEEII
jgi:hypothetical protein